MPGPPQHNDGSALLAEARPPSSGGSSRLSKEEYPELLVYEAMTGAVVSSANEFLQSFQSTPESTLVLKSMCREDFFPRFFHQANKLTDDCCQKLVQIIRSSSILASYVGAARKIETIYKNIKTIQDELQKPAVGSQPADASPVADPGNQGEPGTVKKWATEDELARQHQSLAQAQTQAFHRIAQYLNALRDLPGALLTYACDKCFAGEVNYQFEHDQVAACKAAINPKLANALETMGRVGAVAKQDLEEERSHIMANIEMQKTHQVLEQMWEAKMEAKLHEEQRFKKIATVALVSLALIVILVISLFVIFVVKH